MWRLYIDNQLISDMPEGLDKVTSSLKRDDSAGVLLYDISLDLISYGGQDAYSIVYNRWKADKYGETSIQLFQRRPDRTYTKVAEGTIMHSSIKLKLVEGSISYKTEDKGFYGLINNNKGISVGITATTTKNGTNIFPPSPVTLKVHKVTNGTYYNDNRRGYLVIDVLKHVMNVITDGTVSISAPAFESGGSYYNTNLTYLLAGGHELHYHPVNPLVYFSISWEKLYSSICKLFCMTGSIQGTFENPVLVIDTPDKFAADGTVFTIPTVPNEINLQCDEKRLYSILSIGSPKEITDSTTNVADIFPFTTFKRETFHFKGTNNVDTRLNLEYDLVTSCGVISDVLDMTDDIADAYADDVFIIETFQNAGAFKSIPTHSVSNTNGTTTIHFYNNTLINQAILSRWSNYLPNSVDSPYPRSVGDVVVSTGAEVSYPGDTAFTFSNSAYQTAGWSTLPGKIPQTTSSGTVLWQIPLWNDFGTYTYGSRTIIGQDTSNAYGGSTTQGNPVITSNEFYTAASPGIYVFSLNGKFVYQTSFNASVTNYGGRHDIFLRADIYNSTGSLLGGYNLASYSMYLSRTGSYLINLSGSQSIQMNTGDYVKFNVKVDIYSPTTQLSYGLYCLCSDLAVRLRTAINPPTIDVDPAGYKSMILDFSYPLSLTDYESLKNNKEGVVRVPLKDGTYLSGWINNVSYDHNTGLTKFNLLTDGYKIS